MKRAGNQLPLQTALPASKGPALPIAQEPPRFRDPAGMPRLSRHALHELDSAAQPLRFIVGACQLSALELHIEPRQ